MPPPRNDVKAAVVEEQSDLVSISGFTADQIRTVAWDLRSKLHRKPTNAEIAERLYTSESTLARNVKELGMEWPPRAPKG